MSSFREPEEVTTTSLPPTAEAPGWDVLPAGGGVALLVLGLLLVALAYSLARRIARYELERQAMIRLVVEASSTERRRLAGELHDGVIQDLAGVGYALTALDAQIASLGNSGSSPPVGALRATLRTAQRLVHDDVLALRELTGMQYAADSGAADPAAALRVIVAGAREKGTPVEMIVEELPTLPAAHRAALIRVGREGLRNAAKHAPGANVVLTLGVEDDNAVVTVSDDGPGFDPASALGPMDGHIGLALLTDAAEAVNGRLDLRSRPGKGTTVRLVAPIPYSPSNNGGSRVVRTRVRAANAYAERLRRTLGPHRRNRMPVLAADTQPPPPRTRPRDLRPARHLRLATPKPRTTDPAAGTPTAETDEPRRARRTSRAARRPHPRMPPRRMTPPR